MHDVTQFYLTLYLLADIVVFDDKETGKQTKQTKCKDLIELHNNGMVRVHVA